MNDLVVITACALKHDRNSVEEIIVSLLEANDDNSDSIVDIRDYTTIKNALLNGKAQAYLTTGDPKTKLDLIRLEGQEQQQYALYSICGHYCTSNSTPIGKFIESVTDKINHSVRRLEKDKPRAGTASVFFNDADQKATHLVSGSKEKAEAALEFATKLWESLNAE